MRQLEAVFGLALTLVLAAALFALGASIAQETYQTLSEGRQVCAPRT